MTTVVLAFLLACSPASLATRTAFGEVIASVPLDGHVVALSVPAEALAMSEWRDPWLASLDGGRAWLVSARASVVGGVLTLTDAVFAPADGGTLAAGGRVRIPRLSVVLPP